MSSIAHRTERGGQTTMTPFGLHAHFRKAKAVPMRLSAQLRQWAKEAAEQSIFKSAWQRRQSAQNRKEAAEQLIFKSAWQRCRDYLKQILATIDLSQHHKFIPMAPDNRRF